MWLDQFDSSAVRIEKVDLPLAVLTDFYLDGSGVVLALRTRFEYSDGFRNIGRHQTNVIPDSRLSSIKRLGVKHQLEIVVTIRDPHVDPTQFLAGCAAPPELLEAKDIAIEFHGRLERAHQHTDMVHPHRDARVGHDFPSLAPRPTVRV